MGDEEFYQIAIQEYDDGNADEGLLAKAWVNANGDDSRRKVEYVKLRVSQLKTVKIKRVASAAGSAAKVAAPSIAALAFFLITVAAFIFIAAIGISLLSELTGEPNFGSIIGSVLAGVLVIYLISRLIEWALLKRIIQNRAAMIILSTAVSFFLILALWYSGKDKPYAVHPDLLLSFLLASILLVFGRTCIPSNR